MGGLRKTNQGYRDRQDPSITLTFPLAERKGESILVWTTTPWTLPSNLAIAVGASMDYVLIDGYWIAEARANAYFKEPQIAARCKGRDFDAEGKFTDKVPQWKEAA